MSGAVLGVDIGTSSSKGVLVSLDGQLLATATREHAVLRPAAGHVEMDGRVWWREFVELSRELVGSRSAGAAPDVVAVGVSGMGPCTLLTDGDGEPLRPAILYGVDTRAGAQIAALTARYTAPAVVDRCGSALTSQAVGPKLAWVADNEVDVFARARRLFMPSSFLVWHLTGEYVLDHHSASQSVPLYDAAAGAWYQAWWDDIAGEIEQPRLAWSDEIAGTITAAAARETGLPEGTPITAGTVDAWAEAVSVDAHNPGDLMLMYGTTMFLVCTVAKPVSAPPLWGTVGVFAGSRNLAAGMATSGAVTAWLRELLGGGDYADLVIAADASGPGSQGLLMLPYFAGERTPVEDADARGVIAGLTLSHTAGDLYRAALEATAMGVRHNVEAFAAAGAPIERVVAVGGGVKGDLWAQIVSDVTGLRQQVRTHSIGASFGSAYLAARAIASSDGDGDALSLDDWNPPAGDVVPTPEFAATYDRLYGVYRDLSSSIVGVSHALADFQKGL